MHSVSSSRAQELDTIGEWPDSGRITTRIRPNFGSKHGVDRNRNLVRLWPKSGWITTQIMAAIRPKFDHDQTVQASARIQGVGYSVIGGRR